jgi:hypothetical protein
MHDYEIRDLLRRGQVPELIAKITFGDGTLWRTYYDSYEMVEINTVMENISSEPSLYSLFEFYIDQRLDIHNRAGFKMAQPKTIGQWSLNSLQKTLMVPNDFPLMRGSSVTVGPPLVTIGIPKQYFGQTETFLIGYSALTSGFRQNKFATLQLKEQSLSITEFFDAAPAASD